ncbi:MAG TPA: OmpA family protein [Vicinamibacterales bacterium]|nr:OmpA family protein [Vicinamibacterales bacterium]
MFTRHALRVAVVLVAPLALQACATKGFVRREVTAARAASDSAVVAEREARIAADSALAVRIAALRADLDSLRTQFNVRVVALEGGLRFATPVTFAFDDAGVRGDALPMLQRFAQVATRYYPASTITIEGFADPAGSQRYNLALSQRRAENVRAQLASFGLSANQLRAVGYGETRPVVPDAEKDEPGAQTNRRVVFVIENVGSEAIIALAPPRG